MNTGFHACRGIDAGEPGSLVWTGLEVVLRVTAQYVGLWEILWSPQKVSRRLHLCGKRRQGWMGMDLEALCSPGPPGSDSEGLA